MTRIALVSGSLRGGSTNTAVVRTAAALHVDGVETVVYEGMGGLPHFNPDDDPPDGSPPAPVARLRAVLADADALLVCTPEYAGALPGSFKNLLEWTVGGASTYEMPVAWINAAGPAAPTAATDAHDSLRKVLVYTGARIVDEACAQIPVERGAVGADGLIADPSILAAIGDALAALAAAVDTGPR